MMTTSATINTASNKFSFISILQTTGDASMRRFALTSRQRRCHGKGCIDLATLRKRGRDTRQNCTYELPEGNLTDGCRAPAFNDER